MPKPCVVTHPYEALTPDAVLDAVESTGLRADGRLMALNSYENRVFQIGVEPDKTDASTFVVAKFYRPDRWLNDAILEEHAFALALAAEEIPVVAPMRLSDTTLPNHKGFRFALFPRQGGRWPDLDAAENLRWIGRFLGRIHLLGAAKPFAHRPHINVDTFGRGPAQWLLQSDRLPTEYKSRYESLTAELLERVADIFDQVSPHTIRLHGDCHPGNILWTDAGPHFVDLDDCRMGPAIQDLWMLLSGDREEQSWQLNQVLEGYRLFRDFDPQELRLIEPLRSLRYIHYAAWLARRWDDPAFPPAFPWFDSPRYWEEHSDDLSRQLDALNAPLLAIV